MGCNTRNGVRARRASAALALIVVVAMSLTASARVYTLNESVEIAITQNGSLGQAREDIASSGAGLMSSWSGALPHLSANATHTKYLNVIEGVEADTDFTSGQIRLSQTIFDGPTFARIAGAYHTRDAAEHSFEWTYRDVVFGAKQQYYTLLKAEKLQIVAEENLEFANEQLRKTESLFELGSASRSDLLKARVQVQAAELTLITAQKGVGMSRASLRLYLALDPMAEIEVVDPPEDQREEEVMEFDLEEAIARRPDMMAWEETVTAAKRSLLASQAGWWPALNLSLSYSRDPESIGDFFDQLRNDYTRSASVSLNFPFFSGLSTKANSDRSKAALRSLELAYRDARLQAAYEIETARLTVLEKRESVEVAEEASASAEEDMRISEERFRLRAASMLDVIDARVGFSTARAELVRALYDHEIAKADMKRVLGL